MPGIRAAIRAAIDPVGTLRKTQRQGHLHALRRNHRQIDSDAFGRIEASIRSNYHTAWRSEASQGVEAYRDDLAAHLHLRLANDRNSVVPWLDHARPLNGRRILEIGCGTGSSTVALSEQGASVVGIDVDEPSLQVARDRCAEYGIEAEFLSLNADRILQTYGADRFDTVIFFACLEHMTVPERLAALSQAWAMLPAGGLLAVIETPNRLWYEDTHTARLPFYHWLPDDLAFRYAKFSPRKNFNDVYSTYDDASKLHFRRRGRGVSYHEFDLAIAPAATLDVVSSLRGFHGSAHSAVGAAYKLLLGQMRPDLHEGLFDDYLDIIIRKSHRD